MTIFYENLADTQPLAYMHSIIFRQYFLSSSIFKLANTNLNYHELLLHIRDLFIFFFFIIYRKREKSTNTQKDAKFWLFVQISENTYEPFKGRRAQI